ncbi:hypothetical protein DFH07DRAFT_778761 [Mycena maculata]|uniref:Uncharacterized protein n=1 Tax=Mycena maculata TaxID=230809 RepID=A0AAD7IBB1_9AGAR|nr:hypothetical protein DFH07DRAFT_778761 [Mycena maculata]
MSEGLRMYAPSMPTLILELTSRDTQGVVLNYTGVNPLTVSPAIAKVSTVMPGQDLQILKRDKPNQFKTAQGVVVASIHNHKDMALVEVLGGTAAIGTTGFTITIQLE